MTDFGVFASGALVPGQEDGRITLTTYSPDDELIESFTFDTLSIPLTDDNFIGLGGGGPIGRFEIGAVNSYFVFDDVIWEAIPAPCPEDLDGSGAVDFGDILAVVSAWGNVGGPEDLDGSGTVDFGDLLAVLAAWGSCE